MDLDLSIPPQPAPDIDTQGFWEATAAGRLAICRCRQCGLWLQPPLERCRRCAGDTSFEEVSGLGELHSFIVVHHPAVPGYLDDLPYVIGLVELVEQEGLRLPARIVGADAGGLRVGQAVEARVVHLAGGSYHVPVFGAMS